MTGPGLAVTVDGRRIPDGCLPAPLDDPTGLGTLTVQWGRENTVDQPGPATCTFSVIDYPTGNRFTDWFRIGSTVVVNGDATVWGDPWADTLQLPLAVVGVGCTVVVTGTRIDVYPDVIGAWCAVRITPLPPSPFPTAWDTVPRTASAQGWRLLYALATSIPLGGPGGPTAVEPLAYDSPASNPVPLPPVAGSGVLFTPPVGVWLGMQVEWWPTSTIWANLAPAMTWATITPDPAVTWRDLARLTITGPQVQAQSGQSSRTAQVFYGRITDLDARWVDDLDAAVLDVIAADDLADLANRTVGSTPWNVETLGARWNHILTSAGVPVPSNPPPASVASIPMTYRDVDSLTAGDLLTAVARSVDGVLAVASHVGTGPLVTLYTMRDRAPLYVLDKVGGVVIIVPADVVGPDGTGIVLDACLLQVDPHRWQQNVTDIATRAAITWQEQGTNPTTQLPQITARTATLIDAPLELTAGAHRVAVTTELISATEANSLAGLLLARLARRGWAVSGIVWDLAEQDNLTALELRSAQLLLDAATRNGLPVLLTGLPEWAPAPQGGEWAMYLEGGRYEWSATAWQLELFLSLAIAVGASLVRWVDLPTATPPPAKWLWQEFDPAIRWIDLSGVGV